MKKLTSILLVLALVLTGPAALAAEAPPEPEKASAPAPDFDATVTDAFSYESGDGLTFRVPKIEYGGEGIQAVNDAIWADLYEDQLYSEYGAMTAIEEGWSPEPYRVSYEWSLNGDVLSLLTVSSYSGDYDVYSVYNVSLSAGRRMADQELLDVLGIAPEDFYGLAGMALTNAFEESNAPMPEDEFKAQQRQANNAEANVRAVRPYLDGSGDLCVVATVYALAGAGQYYRPLTILESGELPAVITSAGLPQEAPADSRLAYFLERCDSEALTRTDLDGFDAQMCLYARNGIYARSGRKFLDQDLQRFYEQFDWYDPAVEPARFTDGMLNDYQVKNLALVLAYEADMGY